ncbi:hypothetical protein HMPREF9577_01548 [Cutibacterium acnes HL110PA3]|jgi:hypothetical protein|nr:hypothetical protein HMPREF9603_00036 [Cutibacterium acnes HL001PA1]EFT11415.1 hypothetical protein HMPREF9619_00129 [Cutibacterium acnes HL082PA2]EFT25806.1 hypothetical protein HMPREF9577_01548 [Cutibacterium acnes HL110PA3]EGE70329.1 hypothetical protein HMPREF9341_00032 [Cutibacterium acnes HL103PA1]
MPYASYYPLLPELAAQYYHHTDDVKNPSQSSQQNWLGFFTKQLRR